MWAYNPDIVHNETGGTWHKIPDRRVMYESDTYPWIIAAYRYHNKVNMHGEWDMVHVDMPAKVFTSEHMAAKGQHYIVHFSSRSGTDSTYTDAIDVNVLPTPVDPALMYGKTNGQWGWSKTDHCQFTNAKSVVSPIRNATTDVLACHADMTDVEM